MIKSNRKGFTIIEILLALSFFAFILTFIVAGFVFVSRSYTSGVIVKQVQENARLLLDDVTRELRIMSDADDIVYCSELDATDDCSANGINDVNRLCLGDGVRYGWNLSDPGSTVSPKIEPFSIWKVSDSLPCEAIVDPAVAISSVAEDLDLFRFNVEQIPNTDAYRVDIVMAPAGESVVDNSGEFVCDFVADPQSAYCRVVRVTTVVKTIN